MIQFTINKKVYYVEKELDFKYLVMLDKNGIKVTNVAGLAAVNCFLAYVSGMPEEIAANEISQHVINGGKLDDIVNAYAKALEESGFFRALMEQAEERQAEVEQTETEVTSKKRRVKAVTE
jgi:N-glycosylase/DNA lyase